MPDIRRILKHLKRDELVELLVRFGLSVYDRRKRDQIVDALASSEHSVERVLEALSRNRLRQLCSALCLNHGAGTRAYLI